MCLMGSDSCDPIISIGFGAIPCRKLVVFQHSLDGFCQVKIVGSFQIRMTILSVDPIQNVQMCPNM